MNELTIIDQNGKRFINSRDVAELTGKRHDHLLRDIQGYWKTLDNANAPNFGAVDFFAESHYIDAKNEPRCCYLITRKGCDLIAHKMTGEKGVLFTAAYIQKFGEMEQRERLLDAIIRKPSTGEYNSAARTILAVLQAAGLTMEETADAMQRIYNPLGIPVFIETEAAHRFYPVSEIARSLGILSAGGRPHTQAVSAIIDTLDINESHHAFVSVQRGCYVNVSIRYDKSVTFAVWAWLEARNWPSEIQCKRTYKITYGENAYAQIGQLKPIVRRAAANVSGVSEL